jgi:hypothetical protein
MTASGVNHDALQLQALIGLAVPGRPIGPWSRRTGAPEASATGRNRTSVRAGSVAHRDHTGTGGHQRSPTAKRTCRSTSLQLRQLAQRQAADQIVVPTLHPEIGERCRPVIDDLCHHVI